MVGNKSSRFEFGSLKTAKTTTLFIFVSKLILLIPSIRDSGVEIYFRSSPFLPNKINRVGLLLITTFIELKLKFRY